MKKLILIFLLISNAFLVNANPQVHRDSIIKYAQSFLGTRYLYGGTSASGFDCSGFIYHVFNFFKQEVPRVSRYYQRFGETVELKKCQPADIIVFTGTNASIRQPGHVGLVLSNQNGVIDFIHASSSKAHFGVTITRYNNSGYVKRFLKVISVLNDKI